MHDDDLIAEASRKRPALVGVALMTVGAILVVAGIILGPIPVVPGFPLVLVGLGLIGYGSERARRIINRSERRLPQRIRRALRGARDLILTRRSAGGSRATSDPTGTSPPNSP
jgi:hypothetical protein